MLDDTINRICEFARRYRSEHEMTPRQIYEEAGYDLHHSEITQDAIEAVLRRDQTLIEEWLRLSEDKRWTPSWGLEESGDHWLLYRASESGRALHARFRSPVAACALLVRMEMEGLRLGESQPEQTRDA